MWGMAIFVCEASESLYQRGTALVNVDQQP